MSDAQSPSYDRKIPWLFFLNSFSLQFGITVTLQYMQNFMTEYMMLSPAIVAGILTIGRLTDLAVSTFSGGIVQKANLKTGPYRTWLLIAGPSVLIGVTLIFLNPNISTSGKVIVLITGYFFRNIIQNFVLAGQNGLIAKISRGNVDLRLAMTARALQGTNSSGIITSIITLPMILFLNAKFGNGRGFLIIGAGYALFYSIGMVIVYFATAKHDQYEPNLKHVQGSTAQVKVSHMYGDTLKNSQVWILALSTLSQQIATFTFTPMQIYYFRHSAHNVGLLTISLTATAVVGLVSSLICPPIAKKIGKKNSRIVSGFLTGAAYLAMGLFSDGRPVVYIVCVCLARATMQLVTSIGINLWLDAAEYQLYKTGKDSRPFVMSVQAITMKIGQTISSYTFAFVLLAAGYKSISVGVAEVASTSRFVLAFGGIVGGLFFLSALIMFFFSITEQKSREYAAHNHRLMEERKAEAAAKLAAASGAKQA
jgi:Na+/melibiose symporter-like transporter